MINIYNYFLYAWYRYPALFVLFIPFSLVYGFIIFVRRLCYRYHILKQYRAAFPVIVVGNFVVGGTGKTPMVIALAQFLKQSGFNPGIVTRGYAGDLAKQNILITSESDPKIAGDEAILIAKQSLCPVLKNKNRSIGAQALAEQCDVIISDDGLQHYGLYSDIRIAMMPDKKWMRNPFLLPAGPWRETKKHLSDVDFVLDAKPVIEYIYPLHVDMQKIALDVESFKNKTVHAVCAIAAPWRFFSMLNDLGIKTINHALPDHYLLTQKDLIFSDAMPILITEKDAVKCADIDSSNIWVVKIKTELDSTFKNALLEKLTPLRKHS